MRRCRCLAFLYLGAAALQEEDQGKTFPGCCFTIGYGAEMAPCCLTTTETDMEDCWRAETRDAGVLVVTAQKGEGIGGSSAAHSLGADRGWRAGGCPSDAEEAYSFISDDQDERNSQALGVSLHKEHNALPWWAWVVITCALGLAIVVGILQVLEEHHKQRVRLRAVKRGDGIEEAQRAISRWTRSSSAFSEVIRNLPTPSPSSAGSPSPELVASPQAGARPPSISSLQVLPGNRPYLQVPVSPPEATGAPPGAGRFSPMVQVSPSVYQAAPAPAAS